MSLGSGLISQYGIRTTYLLLGIVSGLAGMSYFLTYRLYLRKVEIRRLTANASDHSKKLHPANGEVRDPAESLGLRTEYDPR